MRRTLHWTSLAAALAVGAACGSPVPPTPSPAPSPTSPPTAAPTPAATPTATPQPTETPTPTAPPTPSPEPTPVGPLPELTGFPSHGPGTLVSAVAHGGAEFVAVGHTEPGGVRGRIWTSSDGQSWTAQPDEAFDGVRFDFVVTMGTDYFALGLTGQGFQAWRSGNGVEWAQVTDADALDAAYLYGVTANDAGLLAAATTEDPSPQPLNAVLISSDGARWQPARRPPGSTLRSVATMAELVVGITDHAVRQARPLWYSTDGGERWQAAELPLFAEDRRSALVDLAASNGRICVVGYIGGVPAGSVPLALVSTDGADWTLVELPARDQWFEQVVAVEGGFLAVGVRADEVVTWTSADGLDWSEGVILYSLADRPPPAEGQSPGGAISRRAVGAGPAGAVVAETWPDGNLHVWFVPLGTFGR